MYFCVPPVIIAIKRDNHNPRMANRNKCVFLDRDGVINRDRGDYTYRVEDFEIIEGVVDALHALRQAGFLVVVITNQAGISKGLYTRQQMQACHDYLQEAGGGLIDAFYYCPYHPTITQSLARKPGTLMLEKAIARFNIDTQSSWLVGDAERDIESGNKMGITSILITSDPDMKSGAQFRAQGLLEAVHRFIVPQP
jgi:D-glycero-D-manno-heptose 1,7-bisphosphate phosphatase